MLQIHLVVNVLNSRRPTWYFRCVPDAYSRLWCRSRAYFQSNQRHDSAL